MKKYGLIGKTLKHSFSKKFFTDFFKTENIEATYENLEIDKVVDVENVFLQNFSGLNVTIPYKEEVIPFLDDLSDEASVIGAVNVISWEGGKVVGHNTDAYGFHQSIKPFLSNQHERAVIFGTGGASKAIAYVLKSLGIDVVFVSRNPTETNHFSYSEVNKNMVNACKLIVNCTPVGMFPDVNVSVELPFGALTEHHLVVDLIYNPKKTLLLKRAEESGAMVLNGESMLKHQAIKAWEIWNK